MSAQKIGRNDPCPCGSGKKYKKCHGASPALQVRPQPVPRFSVRLHPTNTVPPEVLAKAIAITREQQRQEQERQRRYGFVRPEIAADYHGYKFVAIGSTLLYMPGDRCRFLTDVLLAYVPQLFGQKWFEEEIAKLPSERHPVMQWRIKGMNYMNAQPRLPDGSYCATPTGPLLAYVTFAYDLYVVAHNGRLDDRLVERLKQMDQFQGARHELFAEATCLRAGFEIQREDEKDRSRRHAEFTARHLTTGQMISVEAKSKHRPGVLAQAGIRESANDVNLRFGHLLNDAVSKNPPHPLVVFLDMNMPYEAANRLLTPRPSPPPIHPFILRTLDRMRRQHGGRDPITQLIITSHPSHYTKDHEIPPHPHMLGQISLVPLKPARMEALSAITNATNLYGNIPQELPKNFGQS
jgi:SEC-C motif